MGIQQLRPRRPHLEVDWQLQWLGWRSRKWPHDRRSHRLKPLNRRPPRQPPEVTRDGGIVVYCCGTLWYLTRRYTDGGEATSIQKKFQSVLKRWRMVLLPHINTQNEEKTKQTKTKMWLTSSTQSAATVTEQHNYVRSCNFIDVHEFTRV